MRTGKRRISHLPASWLVIVGIAMIVAAALLMSCSGKTDTTAAPPTTAAETPTTAAQATFGGFPAGSACADCHNDGTLMVSKRSQMEERSVHGTGEAFEEGDRTACAGCHGTEGAKARINAGLPPHDKTVQAIVNVSPMGCRTCHNVHTTYTTSDWAVTGGEKPVKMEYTAGTFDKGAGNLCVNCHQIRNPPPKVTAGQVEITSVRFGTHYGTVAQMLLGEGGLGGVVGTPSVHYQSVDDSCVSCHMGSEFNHTMDSAIPDRSVNPNTMARCTNCHAGLETVDRNQVQTNVQALLDQAKAALIKAGIMNAEDELSIPGTYPEVLANAFWNYKMVAYDGSRGVHNSAYAKTLLQYVIDNVK